MAVFSGVDASLLLDHACGTGNALVTNATCGNVPGEQ